jgi:hypothetical protein
MTRRDALRHVVHTVACGHEPAHFESDSDALAIVAVGNAVHVRVAHDDYDVDTLDALVFRGRAARTCTYSADRVAQLIIAELWTV